MNCVELKLFVDQFGPNLNRLYFHELILFVGDVAYYSGLEWGTWRI